MIRWYKFIRLNFWMIFICAVLGSALGITYVEIKPGVYESNSVIYSNLIGKSRLSQVLQDISDQVATGSRKSLANQLGIEVESAAKIKSVEIEEETPGLSKSEHVFNDFEDNCITLVVKVGDPSIFPKVQEGIVKYVEGNEFLLRISQERQKSLKRMILKIDEQIASLEKYQSTSISTMEEGSENIIMNGEMNSASVDMISLLEKKANYEEEASMGIIEFIKPFYIPERPVLKLVIFAVAGLLFGFMVGLAVAVIRKMNSLD